MTSWICLPNGLARGESRNSSHAHARSKIDVFRRGTPASGQTRYRRRAYRASVSTAGTFPRPHAFSGSGQLYALLRGFFLKRRERGIVLSTHAEHDPCPRCHLSPPTVRRQWCNSLVDGCPPAPAPLPHGTQRSGQCLALHSPPLPSTRNASREAERQPHIMTDPLRRKTKSLVIGSRLLPVSRTCAPGLRGDDSDTARPCSWR